MFSGPLEKNSNLSLHNPCLAQDKSTNPALNVNYTVFTATAEARGCQALAGTHHPLLLTRCPRTMWLMVAIKRSISDRGVNEFGENTDMSAFTLERLSNI